MKRIIAVSPDLRASDLACAALLITAVGAFFPLLYVVLTSR
jgi:hypothetical protein